MKNIFILLFDSSNNIIFVFYESCTALIPTDKHTAGLLSVIIPVGNEIACLNCRYYAHRSSLIEREKDLAEKDRSKLHVNTKRPVHDDPDRYYTVTRFIDFDKHLFDQSKEENYYERPDIGVFVVRPILLRRN